MGRCLKINRTTVITNKPHAQYFVLFVCVCLHVRHKNREGFGFGGETGSERGRRDYIRGQREKVTVT